MGDDEDWVDVWLEVQVDGRANLYNWYNEPERAAAVLDKARPLVEAGIPCLVIDRFLTAAAFNEPFNPPMSDDETLGHP